jgi:Mg2+ and Co2+ transporter CorA
MNKWVLLVLGVVAIALAVVLSRGCDRPAPVDPWQARYDSLQAVATQQQRIIAKAEERIGYYMAAFQAEVRANDSLMRQGARIITRYRTVRDTALMVAVCDTLADDYARFIIQTEATIRAADSVIGAQGVQIGNLTAARATDGQIAAALEEKIKAQEAQIEGLRKLAKRRGRVLEW